MSINITSHWNDRAHAFVAWEGADQYEQRSVQHFRGRMRSTEAAQQYAVCDCGDKVQAFSRCDGFSCNAGKQLVTVRAVVASTLSSECKLRTAESLSNRFS